MRTRSEKAMDDEILMMLLRREPVGMELRIGRGMWPHGPIELRTLAARIAEELKHHRWFPREWAPAEPGKAVHEGGTIERVSPIRYVYRTQRHHPLSPTTLAEQSRRAFFTAGAAARHYLRWDLNLPGNLDGYQVVRRVTRNRGD